MEQDLEVRRLFEETSAAACESLFGRYGVRARRADENDEAASPDLYLCAIIGYTGRHIRGTLVLALTEDLSGLSNPVAHPLAGRDRAIHRDWVGELSNQLLGQIKMDLLRYGVEIHMNLPAVLHGHHLAPLPRARLKPIMFTVANGAAAVWIEYVTSPGFRLEPVANSAADQGPAPGEALLFD